MMLTRSRCRDESGIGLAVVLHVAFIATGAIAIPGLGLAGPPAAVRAAYPFLLNGWAAMSAGAWSLMALLGLLSAAFSLGVPRAYQVTPPPIAAVFDYGYLVSAALWGFFLFAERPDVTTLSGMILIASAGLVVAVRRGGAGGVEASAQDLVEAGAMTSRGEPRPKEKERADQAIRAPPRQTVVMQGVVPISRARTRSARRPGARHPGLRDPAGWRAWR